MWPLELKYHRFPPELAIKRLKLCQSTSAQIVTGIYLIYAICHLYFSHEITRFPSVLSFCPNLIFPLIIECTDSKMTGK